MNVQFIQDSKMQTANSLKALINAPEILICPGVFDGFSARLVEKMGFKAAGISGAGLSESRLGWADMGLMRFKENLDGSAATARCCNLVLIADAPSRYGSAVHL